VVIGGFTAPRRKGRFLAPWSSPCEKATRYIGHVGTGFSHKVWKTYMAKLIKLKATIAQESWSLLRLAAPYSPHLRRSLGFLGVRPRPPR